MKMLLRTFAETSWMISSFLLFSCIAVHSEFTIKPKNTLAQLGEETSLQCCSLQSNSTLEWKFQKLNDYALFNLLCRNTTCRSDGYSIDSHPPGCSRLVINSALARFAGLYQCSEVGAGDVGAYLVVYQFNCSHSFSSKTELVEGVKVIYTCTTPWNGELPFQMVITRAGGKEMKKSVFSQIQDLYSSFWQVDLSRPILPSYIFSVQFLSTGITDENVDKQCPVVNVSFPEERVMYRVSNIRTNCPKKDCEKKKGDIINCSADGFPLPTFQWRDWDMRPMGDESVLKMNELGSFEFTCVAQNTINEQEFEEQETILVTVSEKAEFLSALQDLASKITGIFVVLISILIVMLVNNGTIRRVAKICFRKVKTFLPKFCFRKKNKSLQEENQESTPVQEEHTAAHEDISRPHDDDNASDENENPQPTDVLLHPLKDTDKDIRTSGWLTSVVVEDDVISIAK